MEEAVTTETKLRENCFLVEVPQNYIRNRFVGYYLRCPICNDFILKGKGYGKCRCGNISIDSDMLRVSYTKCTFMEIKQYWNIDPFSTCPVCGFQGLQLKPYENYDLRKVRSDLQPPYENVFGKASYEVCDCCGFEFGNDDNPGTAAPQSFQEYRKEWEKDGMIWFNKGRKPADWTLKDQLIVAGII